MRGDAVSKTISLDEFRTIAEKLAPLRALGEYTVTDSLRKAKGSYDRAQLDLVTGAVVWFLRKWAYEVQDYLSASMMQIVPCDFSEISGFLAENSEVLGIEPEDSTILTEFVCRHVLLNDGSSRRAWTVSVAEGRPVAQSLRIAENHGDAIALRPMFLDSYARLHDYEIFSNARFDFVQFLVKTRIANEDDEGVEAVAGFIVNALKNERWHLIELNRRVHQEWDTLDAESLTRELSDARGKVVELLNGDLLEHERRYETIRKRLSSIEDPSGVDRRHYETVAHVHEMLLEVQGLLDTLVNMIDSIVGTVEGVVRRRMTLGRSRSLALREQVLGPMQGLSLEGLKAFQGLFLSPLVLQVPQLVATDLLDVSPVKLAESLDEDTDLATTLPEQEVRFERVHDERMRDVSQSFEEFLERYDRATLGDFVTWMGEDLARDFILYGIVTEFAYRELALGHWEGVTASPLDDEVTVSVASGLGNSMRARFTNLEIERSAGDDRARA